MKILLVEDERRLNDSITHVLKENKYNVDSVYDGDDGYYYIMSDVYDLVILDVNLPRMSGFEVLQRVRTEGNHTLIMMLTARSEVEDRVKGLDLGADDYLPKPFATKELLARVKALSRRNASFETNVKSFGDFSYDSDNFKLSKNNKFVTLTNLEGQLLDLLLSRRNMITPKETIIVKLWGYDSEADDNNVEVYIFFFKKKLKYIESTVTIKTTRNVGYSLEGIGNV